MPGSDVEGMGDGGWRMKNGGEDRELSHMDRRKSIREEMLRELSAPGVPQAPSPPSLLPPLQFLQRAEENTVKFWSLLPRGQGTLLTSWPGPLLWEG